MIHTKIHTMEVDSVQLDFGLRCILSDVHVKCETGKITGLLGRNGQGKTCLMRIIYGDIESDSRSVRFDKTPIPQAYKRPDLLLYLPQFHFIPGYLTLKRVFSDFNLEFGDLERRFPEFKPRYRSTVRHLSGGEKRLIHIYIIARSPSRFAMLDEPFSHLMPLQVEKVKELLQEEKNNKGLLITDHLYRDIISLSDYLYVLVNGQTHLTKKMEDIERLGYARFTP
jgi:ABC-type multidrug transport system ATPase subunit